MEKIFVSFPEMKSVFLRILKENGFSETRATICADIFATNSLEGVLSHGVNRFPRFIENIRKGYVIPGSEPTFIKSAGAIEQWDGNLGPGPLNALTATDRAMDLAKQYGTGTVAMRNTNHWMRGGSYGWKAAGEGFAFIAWTNTEGNMPAWGASDCRLGNNPLVIAVPYGEHAIVLDFAMSLYSYGKMEMYSLEGRRLPFPGGFDSRGELTDDPAGILETRRTLPAGYWKGSGLSLMLDILAAGLSGGLSTGEISKGEAEYSLSQIFIAISPEKICGKESFQDSINRIISDLKNSVPVNEGASVRYPGESVLRTRQSFLSAGIPVNRAIWDKILSL